MPQSRVKKCATPVRPRNMADLVCLVTGKIGHEDEEWCCEGRFSAFIFSSFLQFTAKFSRNLPDLIIHTHTPNFIQYEVINLSPSRSARDCLWQVDLQAASAADFAWWRCSLIFAASYIGIALLITADLSSFSCSADEF